MNKISFELKPFSYFVKNYFSLKENSNFFSDRSRLKMINSTLNGESMTCCAFDGKKIVGFCVFDEFKKDHDFLLLENIEVDLEYRNNGIAKRMLEEQFKYIASCRKGVISSMFSRDGLKYIKHKLSSLSDFYGIRYFESELDYNYNTNCNTTFKKEHCFVRGFFAF